MHERLDNHSSPFTSIINEYLKDIIQICNILFHMQNVFNHAPKISKLKNVLICLFCILGDILVLLATSSAATGLLFLDVNPNSNDSKDTTNENRDDNPYPCFGWVFSLTLGSTFEIKISQINQWLLFWFGLIQ